MLSLGFDLIQLAADNSSHVISFVEGASTEERKLVYSIVAGMNVVSLLGSLFSIGASYLLSDTKNSFDKMIFGLASMDLIYNAISLFQATSKQGEFFCSCSSFAMIFGWIGSLFWTCCFAHFIYKLLKNTENELPSPPIKNYTTISILIGFIFGVLAVITNFDQIDKETQFCAHQTSERTGPAAYSDLVILVIPTISSVMYCITSYVLIIRKIKKMAGTIHIELLAYPLILIICYFPYLLLGVYILFNKDYTVGFWSLLCTDILFNSQGLLNAFTYGYSQRVRNTIKGKCCRRKNYSVTSSRIYDPLSMENDGI